VTVDGGVLAPGSLLPAVAGSDLIDAPSGGGRETPAHHDAAIGRHVPRGRRHARRVHLDEVRPDPVVLRALQHVALHGDPLDLRCKAHDGPDLRLLERPRVGVPAADCEGGASHRRIDGSARSLRDDVETRDGERVRRRAE
jgi:hypothetical protein